MYVLLVLALILIGAAVWDMVMTGRNAAQDIGFLNLNSQQAALSQTLVRAADQALAGSSNAFQDLQNADQEFDVVLNRLLQGNADSGLPPASGSLGSEATVLQGQWAKARPAVQAILSERSSVLAAAPAANAIQQGLPELARSWQALVADMSKHGTPAAARGFASRQPATARAILADANWLTRGGAGDGSALATQLPEAMQNLSRITQALVVGNAELGVSAVTNPDLAGALQGIQAQTDKLRGDFTTLTPLVGDLVQAQQANQTLQPLSAQMLTTIQALQSSYRQQTGARIYHAYIAYILGAIGLALLLLILWLYVIGAEARRAASSQVEQNERNQQAILRLLDELGALADGDLTVQATVSEDITGAIADSINYAVEALRALVRTINDTAVQVDAAARQTQATATHLAEASKNQSKQITTASTSVAQMAHSIEQVSLNADRSAKVAQQSVQIAHKGGEAVRRTIDGMSNIRETIQETSKRIKRLGESSQEIGDIVELINDIAEQTNILALNAAIQASMAGEAGRGFAVVADEVQRLAERSTNATRQIETLVKTIQTDTNEAVISMEQSTAGVVGGAQLAENAGTALNEIEKVANNIATLVQSISRSARQQAQTATEMTGIMNVISEITSQTTDGTVATAQSIGKLAALATEMRKSVSGFKLPSSVAGQEPPAAGAPQDLETDAA
ncbi:MAG: methyl-accepting chemotaxis protein [Gammaproteobacteria bacterium]